MVYCLCVPELINFDRKHFLPSIKFDHSYSIKNFIHHLNEEKSIKGLRRKLFQ